MEIRVEDKISIQSSNPFLIAQAARELEKKDATTEDLTAHASACLRASNMVPAAKVYDHHRAMFLLIGGILVNRACAKDLGTTGLAEVARIPAKGGVMALSIWKAYARYEPFDTKITDETLQQYLLACCYAAKPKLAYAAIIQNCAQRGFRGPELRAAASNRSEFWYDCARICSINGNVSFAANCLQRALTLGYRDKASAKIDPDLKNVRESRFTADLFKRLLP